MRCRFVLASFFAFAFFTLPVRTLDHSQAGPVVLALLVVAIGIWVSTMVLL
jgi:hypothetical protein